VEQPCPSLPLFFNNKPRVPRGPSLSSKVLKIQAEISPPSQQLIGPNLTNWADNLTDWA
jgi:hypothetical protein